MLDGAHNPSGARALASYIREFHKDRPVWLVYGAMRDKAIEEVASQLFPLSSKVIVTAPNFPRALRPEAILGMTDHPNAIAAATIEEAIELAWQAPGDATVFFTGSLFVRRRGARAPEARGVERRAPYNSPLIARLRAYFFSDPLIILSTIFFGSISIAASLFDKKGNTLMRVARVWARSLLRVSGVQVTVEGLEHIDPAGSYVFATNHASYMDTPVVLSSIPVQFRFLAKSGLFKIPFLGTHLARPATFPCRATIRGLPSKQCKRPRKPCKNALFRC